MKRWGIILAGLLIWVVQLGFTQASFPLPSSPQEIRKARIYRTLLWRKALSWPRALIDVPILPLKQAVVFSERADLIHRVRDLLYNEDGTFGRVPTFSYQGVLGTGAGFTLFHTNLFRQKYRANVSFLYAGSENFSFRNSFSTPYAGSGDFKQRFLVHLLSRKDSDEPFYMRKDPDGRIILGQETVDEDAKSYFLNTLEPRLEWQGAWPGNHRLKFRLSGSKANTGQGGGERKIPTDFEGVGSELAFLGGGGTYVWDRRDHSYRPVRGTLIEISGDVSRGVGGDWEGRAFGFTRHQMEVQNFFPLFWGRRRTFLVRGALEKLDPLGDRIAPFYFLPRLDQNHALRGFDRNRFQNQGALVFNLEYRYPIWETWDGVLFMDHGRSFRDYDRLDLSGFSRSYGAAINFMSENGFLFLLQFGRGGDESQVVFSLQQAF